MKRYAPVVLVIALVPLASWLMRPAAATPALKETSPKWEYKAIDRSKLYELGKKTVEKQGDEQLTAGLNALGEEGWQLVAIDSLPNGVRTFYCFRRAK